MLWNWLSREHLKITINLTMLMGNSYQFTIVTSWFCCRKSLNLLILLYDCHTITDYSIRKYDKWTEQKIRRLNKTKKNEQQKSVNEQ